MVLAAANKMPKTGRLREAGSYPAWGGLMTYFACVDCEGMFPVIVEYGDDWLQTDPTHAIKCNGTEISLCPWCRPDSEPWKNGRGK